MPIFELGDSTEFPNPLLAEDGLLAFGGDLSTERLLAAYRNGIFPWYNPGEPILWHAPNPRFVLFPDKLHISHSLKTRMNRKDYSITENMAFDSVITQCKFIVRKDQEGTWITNDMLEAYARLHQEGFAHSIEVWDKQNNLIGGLYGVQLGSVFFGESMFHKERDASKLALVYLSQKQEITLIDCQVHTPLLEQMGAQHITLQLFLSLLNDNFGEL